MASKGKLEQTKGIFKLVGKVKGIDNENALKEGVTKGEKDYKSLSFFIETSPVNKVKVEIFGMERDTVFAYSSEDKKSKAVNWSDRHKSHGKYKLMGVGLGLEQDDKGKNIQKILVEFDAVDYILENLKEGDSVFVQGAIDFQQYEGQDGKVKESKRYQIQRIMKTKNPVDFEDEKFEETASFEQAVVVTSTEKDGDKLYINAKIIKYDGKHVDTQFVLDETKHPKLAMNMKKRLKFGDFIKLYGLVINAVELIEAEEEEDPDDDWGGEKPKGMDNNVIRNYIQELQVTSVDSGSYEAKKYSEEDFFDEDEENYGADEEDEDFDSEEGDDFSGDDDDFDDDSDEDLPFK